VSRAGERPAAAGNDESPIHEELVRPPSSQAELDREQFAAQALELEPSQLVESAYVRLGP
jgi:hypothetical protein